MLRVMTEAGGVPRPGGSKHRGGGGKRGARRLAFGAPLAAAALFLLLLLFSVYSFSSLSSGGGSIEDGSVQPSGGSRTAAERAAHDPSPLRSGSSGGGGHHSSWLSAAALWAEENQEQVSWAIWVPQGTARACAQEQLRQPDAASTAALQPSLPTGAGAWQCRAASSPPYLVVISLFSLQRARSRQDRYRRDPAGCGLLPCTGQRLRRPPTLVVYAYAASERPGLCWMGLGSPLML